MFLKQEYSEIFSGILELCMINFLTFNFHLHGNQKIIISILQVICMSSKQLCIDIRFQCLSLVCDDSLLPYVNNFLYFLNCHRLMRKYKGKKYYGKYYGYISKSFAVVQEWFKQSHGLQVVTSIRTTKRASFLKDCQFLIEEHGASEFAFLSSQVMLTIQRPHFEITRQRKVAE